MRVGGVRRIADFDDWFAGFEETYRVWPRFCEDGLQLGMTRKDLGTLLGGRGRVSEILTKKRSLSLEMVRRLHRKLHISLESLIGTAA